MYVLDTDIIRYGLFNPENYPNLIRHLEAVPKYQQWISIVTAQELVAFRLHPLTQSNQQRPRQVVDNYRRFYELLDDLKRFQILRFDDRAQQHFDRMGAVNVGRRDRRIAATALANGYHVVTNNHQHFERIRDEACPELIIDDWISTTPNEGASRTT